MYKTWGSNSRTCRGSCCVPSRGRSPRSLHVASMVGESSRQHENKGMNPWGASPTAITCLAVIEATFDGQAILAIEECCCQCYWFIGPKITLCNLSTRWSSCFSLVSHTSMMWVAINAACTKLCVNIFMHKSKPNACEYFRIWFWLSYQF